MFSLSFGIMIYNLVLLIKIKERGFIYRTLLVAVLLNFMYSFIYFINIILPNLDFAQKIFPVTRIVLLFKLVNLMNFEYRSLKILDIVDKKNTNTKQVLNEMKKTKVVMITCSFFFTIGFIIEIFGNLST